MHHRILPASLAFIASLAFATGAFAQGGAMLPGIMLPAETRMAIPILDVGLTIDTEGFTLLQSGSNEMGTSTKLMAINPSTGIVMSIFLEFTTEDGDAAAARDHYWKKGERAPLKRSDVKRTDIDGVPVVEHTIVESQGEPMSQRNFNAYWSHNSVWIDLHLSKMDASPEDDELFREIIRSVRVGSLK